MRWTRDPVLVGAVGLALAVLATGWLGAVSWVGHPFPGFLVLGNRSIASAGLARWPATAGGEIYQHEIVAVDGQPLRAARDLADHVRARPVGTAVAYRLRAGDIEREVAIDTRNFDLTDFALLFGSYLAGGIAMCGVAIAIRVLRRRDRSANACALAIWLIGMWALSATDLYGPYRLFRLHAALECFLGAGMIHFALSFPIEREIAGRRRAIVALPYAASALLALVQQIHLFDPRTYVTTHLIALASFGVSLVAVVINQIDVFRHPPSFEARQRVKVLALGVLAATAPGAFVAIQGSLTGGRSSENVMAWSGLLLPAALAYAVLRTDLFEVDAILRRSVNYAIVTALFALSYAGAIAGFESVFEDQSESSRTAFVVLFSAVSVAVIIPLRDSLQVPIDRLFFRSAYDFRQLVQTASTRLSAVSSLHEVLAQLDETVRSALQPEWLVIEYRREQDQPSISYTTCAGPPPAPSLSWDVAGRGSRITERPDGGLAIALRVDERCVGVLGIGRRLSGAFYGGDDRRFLITLANQGAIALQNAMTLESLRDLNRELEEKVRQRTAALAKALDDLRSAQGRLVEHEKMASLGQLVAGIAHEINNPVNFIEGNLGVLNEHAEALGGAIAEFRAAAARGEIAAVDAIGEKYDLDFVLEDLRPLLEACKEGVERTTGIVAGLRTFSRLDRASCDHVDLIQGLESTLALVRDRFAAIRVVRELEPLPPVECVAGQIHQVFMNLLSNAADAVAEGGRVTLRSRRVGEDRVQIDVEDDGCGMSEEVRSHIFEPFYTTKPVGKGTGLGLSISYGIVERHSGTLEVESEPGRGSRFVLTLPIRFARAREPGGDASTQ
jgi:signal transduction histidine kinase